MNSGGSIVITLPAEPVSLPSVQGIALTIQDWLLISSLVDTIHSCGWDVSGSVGVGDGVNEIRYTLSIHRPVKL